MISGGITSHPSQSAPDRLTSVTVRPTPLPAAQRVSPHQVIWHAIMGSCVVGDAGSYDGVLIALANPSCNRRWHELIASAAAHDRDFATAEALTRQAICRDAAYPVAVEKIVSLIGLRSRQAVLFDQLLDLRVAGSFVRLFLLLAAQLLIARGLGKLRPLRSELRVGRRRALFLRQLLSLSLLLLQLPFGFPGLLLIDQARL
ncbi:MAG TPA: hypothetical protein VGN43_21650 [Steroidobacteraceae bacterium]|nr:hypothetical protein [Steroidobacteraceae bacterium]